MGRNVDLIRMVGLPKTVEVKGKTYDVEGALRDYDIDDDHVNPEDGVWVLTFGIESEPDKELCFTVKYKNCKVVEVYDIEEIDYSKED